MKKIGSCSNIALLEYRCNIFLNNGLLICLIVFFVGVSFCYAGSTRTIYGGDIYNDIGVIKEGSTDPQTGNTLNLYSARIFHTEEERETISGGIVVSRHICGAYLPHQEGSASCNTVNIYETVSLPKYSRIVGGMTSQYGDATNNTVNIYGNISSDGDLDICGGEGRGEADGGFVETGMRKISDDIMEIEGYYTTRGKYATVANNAVNIYGTVHAQGTLRIYGGYFGGNIHMNNNAVRIYEDACLSAGEEIHLHAYSGTGSTLEIYAKKTLSVNICTGFERYVFHLLSGINKDDTVFRTDFLGDGRFAPSHVKIEIDLEPGSSLKVGDSVNIIAYTGDRKLDVLLANTVTETKYKALATMRKGTFELSLDPSGSAIKATLVNDHTNEM